MDTNFTNYELNFIERYFLRKLILIHSTRWYPSSIIERFRALGLVTRTRSSSDYICYKPSLQGIMYLRKRRKDNIRFMVPVVISILALLESYEILSIEILRDILLELSLLLKNIMETWDVFR